MSTTGRGRAKLSDSKPDFVVEAFVSNAWAYSVLGATLHAHGRGTSYAKVLFKMLDILAVTMAKNARKLRIGNVCLHQGKIRLKHAS